MTSNNRNKTLQWFVTFPRCTNLSSCNREELGTFAHKFPPYEWVYVVCEKHDEPGDPDSHYHMSIKFIKGITHSKLLDWIKLQWPDDWKRIHIAPTRSLIKTVQYMKKESLLHYEDGSLNKAKSTSTITYSERQFRVFNIFNNRGKAFWLNLHIPEEFRERFLEQFNDWQATFDETEVRSLN